MMTLFIRTNTLKSGLKDNNPIKKTTISITLLIDTFCDHNRLDNTYIHNKQLV